MTTQLEGAGKRPCWFVGAAFGGTDDQCERFFEEGIWENGYQDKHLDLVNSIQVGDRIAIKSTYTRKNNLPFDNRGLLVSVLAIKATGIVKKNYGNGRTLDVEWTPVEPMREWYFFTYRGTIWRVLPGERKENALISFAFENTPQDINAPYWRDRFGDVSASEQRFLWTRFYEAFADKLLLYRDKRDELLKGIYAIASNAENLTYLHDKSEDGTITNLQDICPFTVMGMFNRGITNDKRKNIAQQLATFLEVEEAIPESFEGIPLLHGLKSHFFGFLDKRQDDDINNLWEMFAQAIYFSDSNDTGARSKFMTAYDNVAQQYIIGWNLTMGLYWIRPWTFQTLDGYSRNYIEKKLNIKIELNGAKGCCSADDYLAVLETLEKHFQEDNCPVHSFPELSLTAWNAKDDEPFVSSATPAEMEKEFRAWVFKQINKDGNLFNQEYINQMCKALKEETAKLQRIENIQTNLFCYINSKDFEAVEKIIKETENYKVVNANYQSGVYSAGMKQYKFFLTEREGAVDKYTSSLDEESVPQSAIEITDTTVSVQTIVPYSIDNIITDGCFIERSKLEEILERLQTKKNIILQGPPGTGKTWLAKKLAFALLEEKSNSRVRAVQFHPNLAYEDFVRGWRPSGEGKLTLVDGPFMEIINTAKADPNTKYVIVIEEINRGNPAQIFGEMLTLLEVDKRNVDEALELSYRKYDDERVYIPSNLYVIGTMNIADRSLALVDLALRRRFAFIDLKPVFGEVWQKWICSQCGIEIEIVKEIETKIQALNQEISADFNLGEQFCIGHSFVTPSHDSTIQDAREWFRQVIETEIGPLLDEYWYDSSDKAKKAKERLLEGL